MMKDLYINLTFSKLSSIYWHYTTTLRVYAQVADAFMDEFKYEMITRKVENRGKVLDILLPSKNRILHRL